jgi:hypothetical protein
MATLALLVSWSVCQLCLLCWKAAVYKLLPVMMLIGSYMWQCKLVSLAVLKVSQLLLLLSTSMRHKHAKSICVLQMCLFETQC